MRTKLFQSTLFAVLAVAAMIASGSVKAQERFRDISVTLTADKQEYVPGEAVEIEIKLTNGGNAGRSIGTVGTYGPQIFVSVDGGPFRRYIGPGSSVLDPFSRGEVDLAPAQSATLRSTLLYHLKKPTAHLSELYARTVRETQLDDFFALNRPGIYHLKAAFDDQTGNTKFESEPIEISVIEPRDGDALIWESLKNDRAAALFLHTGDSPAAGASQFAEKMQRLAMLYPTSVHAVRFVAGQKPRWAVAREGLYNFFRKPS